MPQFSELFWGRRDRPRDHQCSVDDTAPVSSAPLYHLPTAPSVQVNSTNLKFWSSPDFNGNAESLIGGGEPCEDQSAKAPEVWKFNLKPTVDKACISGLGDRAVEHVGNEAQKKTPNFTQLDNSRTLIAPP